MPDPVDNTETASGSDESARSVDQALRQRVMSFCAPIWWESARRVVVRSGTMCVIRTPEASIGVTNAHVLDSYERHKRETADVFCQLGSAPFDPSVSLIDRSDRWDLATFSIPELTAAHWGHSVYVAPSWPPAAIGVGDHVVFGGYPEGRRVVAPGEFPESMTTEFVTLRQQVRSSSLEHSSFQFDPESILWLPNNANPLPDDATLSGISGGPCFRIVASENRIELAGIIYEGDYSRGRIWARHLSLVSAGGRISPIPV